MNSVTQNIRGVIESVMVVAQRQLVPS